VPAVSVIVPARNAADTIAATLEALGRQDIGEPYEVIVVDDGSDDETAAIAAATFTEARVLPGPALGAAAARNHGVEASSGEYLGFIDADCVPSERWLREGVAALASADLVQGAVEPDPHAVRAPFDRTVSVERPSGLFETANLFATRALFDRIEGFAELIQPATGSPMGEDVWFGWRARRSGARTSFCAAALVYHEVRAQSARAYVEEHRRRIHFPEMVAHMPELREAFLWNHWFLNRRTAALDTALAGIAVSLATRSRLPLALSAPYAWLAIREASGWRRRAPRALAGGIWADAVSLVALAKGSIRSRAIVA